MDAEFYRELTELIGRYQPEEDRRSDKEREMDKEYERLVRLSRKSEV